VLAYSKHYQCFKIIQVYVYTKKLKVKKVKVFV